VQTSALKFYILLLFTPLLLLCLLVLVMRIVASFRRSVSSQVIVLACAVFGNIPFGVMAYILYLGRVPSKEEMITGTIFFLLTYNALAYSTFHIFNMSDTARRIKILNMIKASGTLRVSDLRSSYGSGEMLANRIERLLSSGQIRKSGSGYVLNSHFLYYAARTINLWAKVLRLPTMKSIHIKKSGSPP